MLRAVLIALLPTLVLLADDVDPEPPAKRAIVKSGALSIAATLRGDVVATDKRHKIAWRVELGKGKSDQPPQLGLVGERVIYARDDTLVALDVKTGKTLWKVAGLALVGTKLNVKDGTITLNSRDRLVNVEAQSGRYTYQILEERAK